MARSKTLHKVTTFFEIEQPNNPSDSVVSSAEGMIDLSKSLSAQLGRTIKQGQNFRVVGVEAHLRPKGGIVESNPETGLACQTRFIYTPTTRASANAWRDLNKHYWKQSSFRAGLGGKTRYDEFECSMYRSQANSRTSRVYVGGINDPSPEYCTIYGEYDDEDGVGDPYDPGTISLKALYDAKHPVPDGSHLKEDDLLFDDSISYKDPKFSSYFPPEQYLFAEAELSSIWTVHDTDTVTADDKYPTGAAASSSGLMLPDGNHLDVLCGLLTVNAWAYPQDSSIWTLADNFYLYVTVWVEGWSPLTTKPKTKKSRSSRRGGRKNSRRTSRRRG